MRALKPGPQRLGWFIIQAQMMMTQAFNNPTAYPAVNEMLARLIPRIQAVLGEQLVGIYLDGSLASGDFDEGSDIDFVAVTQDEISAETFAALQAMHDEVARYDSPWAVQLEGSYLSRHALRRYDPAFTMYPNIERGAGERLKLARHDQGYNTHRWVLRERGITLLGPDPKALIDAVTPQQLIDGMRPLLDEWLPSFLSDPGKIPSRGYQSYIVLTICRICYTLATGGVASKPAAVAWAKDHLDARWQALIERAWQDRLSPDGAPGQEELEQTLALIKYLLAAQ